MLDTPQNDSDTTPSNAVTACDPANELNEGVPMRLRREQIVVLDGHNPRKVFDQTAFERLVESIRTKGLITPITVRPLGDDRYALVAGERRFRALTQLQIDDVPALVRELTEAQAHELALLENLDRSKLTTADEALVAQRHVAAYDGDVAAAAAALGWPESRLRHRLKLLHAVPAVLEALGRDQIKIGHAELLATLPVDKQDTVLARVMEKDVSVSDFKAQLEDFSIPLSRAIFDKAACNGCPHNSSTQSDLFAEHIGDARCTNRSCYQTKTSEHLDAECARLREDVGTVALATQTPEGSTIALTVVGPRAVTAAQLSACAGCKHFGALVDDRLSATTGHVQKPTCFNRSCHNDKVAEAIAEREAAAKAAAEAAAKPAADNPAAEGSATAKPSTAKPSTSKPSKAPTVGLTPKEVARRCDAMQRAALAAAVPQQPSLILGLALYGLHRLRNAESLGGPDLDLSALGIKQSSTTYDDTSLLLKLATSDAAALRQVMVAAVQQVLRDGVMGDQQGRIKRRELAKKLVATFAIDVAPFVVVDEAFLNAHTKAGIEAVLEESGFADWFKANAGEKPDKAWRELLAKGKADLIKAVLAAGFDWSGYIPSALKSL